MTTVRLHLALLLAAAFVFALPAAAQLEFEPVPEDWPHLDLERDGFAGISTYRAYEELLADRAPRRSVVVAVIDSGVDTTHTGLSDRLWTRSWTAPDECGFVGTRFGWSYLGNPAGENVDYDTYEYAREYARLRDRFDGASPDTLDLAAMEKYGYFTAMRDSLQAKRAEFKEYQEMIMMAAFVLQLAEQQFANHFGRDDFTPEEVAALEIEDPMMNEVREAYLYLTYNELDGDALTEQAEYVERVLNYSLDPDFDPRHIVGDNYDDPRERCYGNADVHGPDPEHGTGVSSVITTWADSGHDIRGVAADSVYIMAIRAVPQGDERDKDVANAIRFAVDNGANVINMSFGKPVSPQKEVVDEAVRYAMERGVLMIHAAGNDSRDLTVEPSFPSRRLDDGTEAALWIEVGASTAFPEMLAATFSNYGAGMVDVFAPGESVRVLKPGDTTGRTDGTSFAAPHVAGLAALLMTYFPELSPGQVRDIILETAVRSEDEVLRPGSESQQIPFSTLSTTGGVINVYQAVRRADELTTGASTN